MMRLFTILLLSAISLGACAADPAPTPPSQYQFIIQFRTPVADAGKPEFDHQLSVDAGATLTFIRTLATGAQIYKVESTIERAEFSELLGRLRRRADVLYVEEDRRVQPATRNRL